MQLFLPCRSRFSTGWAERQGWGELSETVDVAAVG
jgi:hypothetical protein